MRTCLSLLLLACTLTLAHGASVSSQACSSMQWLDGSCWVGGSVPAMDDDVTITTPLELDWYEYEPPYPFVMFTYGNAFSVNMTSVNITSTGALNVTSEFALVAGSGGVTVESGGSINVIAYTSYQPATIVLTSGNLTVYGTVVLNCGLVASTGSGSVAVYGLVNVSGVLYEDSNAEAYFCADAYVYNGGWLQFWGKVHLAFWWFPGTRVVTVGSGGKFATNGPRYSSVFENRNFAKVMETSYNCTVDATYFYRKECKEDVSQIVTLSGGRSFFNTELMFFSRLVTYGNVYVWFGSFEYSGGLGQFVDGYHSSGPHAHVGDVFYYSGYEYPYIYSAVTAEGGTSHVHHSVATLPAPTNEAAPEPVPGCSDVPALVEDPLTLSVGVSGGSYTEFDCRHMEVRHTSLYIVGAGELVVTTELLLTRATLVVGDNIEVEFTNAVIATNAHIHVGANSTVTFRASKMTDLNGYTYYGLTQGAPRVNKEAYPHPLTFAATTLSGPGSVVFLHEVLVPDRLNIATHVFFEGEAGEPLLAGGGFLAVRAEGTLNLGLDATLSGSGIDLTGTLLLPADYSLVLDTPIRAHAGSIAEFAGTVVAKAGVVVEDCGGAVSGLGGVESVGCGESGVVYVFEEDGLWV